MPCCQWAGLVYKRVFKKSQRPPLRPPRPWAGAVAGALFAAPRCTLAHSPKLEAASSGAMRARSFRAGPGRTRSPGRWDSENLGAGAHSAARGTLPVADDTAHGAPATASVSLRVGHAESSQMRAFGPSSATSTIFTSNVSGSLEYFQSCRPLADLGLPHQQAAAEDPGTGPGALATNVRP